MAPTWTLTRTRRFYAPNLLIIAMGIQVLAIANSWDNLRAAAAITTLAATAWMLFVTFRDPAETFDTHMIRTLAQDAADPAYRLGAASLKPFADPNVNVTTIRITRGIHDDGQTVNAHIRAYIESEQA